MKKKGFTLVELLAVIVILAIIVLIAVPIVFEMIDNSKKETLRDSVYGIAEAAEIYYTKYQMNNKEFSGGLVSLNELSYKGELDSGSVVFTDKGKYSILIFDGSYCGYKYAGGKESYVGEISEGGCLIDGKLITLNDLLISSGQDESVNDGSSDSNKVESVVIDSNGIIIIGNDKYIITSNGKISKNEIELIDENEKNDAYEKVTKSILGDVTSTAEMLNHKNIMEGLKTNEVALNIILDGFVDYFKAKVHLNYIKNNINDIQSRIENLNGGVAAVQLLDSTDDTLQNTIDILSNITNQSDIIVTNFSALLERSDFFDYVLQSNETSLKLIKNEVFNDLITSNETYFTKVANDKTFMETALEEQVFRTAIYNNYEVTEDILGNSTVALNAIKNSSRYITLTGKFNTRTNTLNDYNQIIYDGKAFVLQIKINGLSTSSTIGSFVSFTPSSPYPATNTYTFNKFVTKLQGARYQASNTCSYTAYIFKI